jgi:hypothetical protein
MQSDADEGKYIDVAPEFRAQPNTIADVPRQHVDDYQQTEWP